MAMSDLTREQIEDLRSLQYERGLTTRESGPLFRAAIELLMLRDAIRKLCESGSVSVDKVEDFDHIAAMAARRGEGINKNAMPDKERVLVTLLRELHTTMLLRGGFRQSYSRLGGEGDYVHFESRDVKNLKAGDLIICNTSGVHDFTLGWFCEVFDLNWNGVLIREIGSDRTCRVTNDSYAVVVGMAESDLWEGDKRRFYENVNKAFWKTGEDWYRYGGLAFNDDGTATITVREKFGGMCGSDKESVPFTVTIPWSKKTTVKKIKEALIAGGVGTRKFEHREKLELAKS